MSGRDELRKVQGESRKGESRNGSIIKDTPEGMRAQLAELLELKQVGLTVAGATVFGNGSTASVDLRLSGESGDVKLTFDRFGDVSKPPALTAALMSSVGVVRTFKVYDAALVGAVIHRLADHHDAQDADDAAREWGAEFLRFAADQEVNLADQAERWRSFSSLEPLDPLRDVGDSPHAVASASVVLVDRSTGVRLVRCGWFLAYVRQHVKGLYTPATLGTQMARVGWERRGSEGWIKATSPTDGRYLRWRFYTVPMDWEDQ